MKIIDDLEGICPYCDHRFRRVFKPDNIADFYDEDGNPLEDFMEKGDIIVLDVCLLSNLPMGKDITYECSHFFPINDASDENDTKIDLLKYFK